MLKPLDVNGNLQVLNSVKSRFNQQDHLADLGLASQYLRAQLRCDWPRPQRIKLITLMAPRGLGEPINRSLHKCIEATPNE